MEPHTDNFASTNGDASMEGDYGVMHHYDTESDMQDQNHVSEDSKQHANMYPNGETNPNDSNRDLGECHPDNGMETMTENSQNAQQHSKEVAQAATQEGIESETAAAERQVHEYRISATQEATSQLEATLHRVKDTTSKMMEATVTFLQASESVTVDYLRCQASQQNEARRLEEVEPDVAGATAAYLQEIQCQMMSSVRRT